MQERVLHLGQHLAEELEHLLPHAWRVLRVRGQDARREREPRPPPGARPAPAPAPAGFLPSSLPRGHLHCEKLAWSALPAPPGLLSLSTTLSLLNTLHAAPLITAVSPAAGTQPGTWLVLGTSLPTE